MSHHFNLFSFPPSLSYAIPLGMSFGLSYTAILVEISRRFDRRRPLALGVGFAGHSIAGFVLAPLFVYTLEEISLTGTLWIFAGVMLQLVVAGMAVVSTHYGTKPGHFETSKIHFPTSEGVSEVSERVNE